MQHAAEKAAGPFPSLLVAADRIADTVVHGLHGRRRSGPGEDFWQFRPYSPGDAAYRVDWRRSAKRNRLFVRETEWAATNTLWVDVSSRPGMFYVSELAPVEKHHRAATLALALGILAIKAGERFAVMNGPYAPGHTRLALTRAAHLLENAKPGAAQDKGEVRAFRHATAVLFSDFFEPIEAISERFKSIAERGATGHVVQVVDPIEETFPFDGRVEFIDANSNARFLAGQAQTLKDRYIDRLARHRAELRDLTRALGWTFTLHHTDQPAHRALMTLHHLISARRPGGANVSAA